MLEKVVRNKYGYYTKDIPTKQELKRVLCREILSRS